MLELLVKNFRNAIELAKFNREKGSFFRDFPTGQCGRTSDLLAQYLIDNGFSQIYYVNGTYYYPDVFDSQEHAWLEVKGLIVDITCDQFKYCDEPLINNSPVYVGPKNSFYELFESDTTDKCIHYGLKMCNNNYTEMQNLYETILTYL